MIPEVEAENYSDDDISVEVPSGSTKSPLSEELSCSSSSRSRSGSICSSIESFNALTMEENHIHNIDDTNDSGDHSEYLADEIQIRGHAGNVNTGLHKNETTEVAEEIERHGTFDNNINNAAEKNELGDSSRYLVEEMQSSNTIGLEHIDTNTNTYKVIDNIDPASDQADTEHTDINTHTSLHMQTDMESQREFSSGQKDDMRREIETDSDVISPKTRNTSILPGEYAIQEEDRYSISNVVPEHGSKASNQQDSQTHSDSESPAIDAYSENSLLFRSSSTYSDESEFGNESYNGCDNSKLSNDSSKTRSEYKSDCSLSSQNHWEEISVDDDVFRKLTEHAADSDTEITIEVVNDGEDDEIEKKDIDDEAQHSTDNNHECSESEHALHQSTENKDHIISGTIADENGKIDNIKRNYPEIVTNMKRHDMNIQDNVTEADINVYSYTGKKVNGDKVRSKSLPVILTRETNIDVVVKYSKSLPCLSYIDKNLETNVATSQCLEDGEDNGDISKSGDQMNDRGVSVSNVILDSRITSQTPTTETSKDGKTEIQDPDYIDELPAITTQTESKSYGNILHTYTSHGVNQGNTEKCDIVNDLPAITAKEILETNRDEDSLPSEKTDYDYKQRRGSYRKIKLEGRRRQRLSISEGMQSTSPAELTDVADEPCNSFHNTVRPISAPILLRRQKMRKISLICKPDNPETASITSKMSVKTAIGIPESDTVIKHEQNKKGHKLQVLQAGCPTLSKSLDSSTHSKVDNINSLNTEIIAIYNAPSSELTVETDNTRRKRKHKSKRKQKKDDDYFEGYDRLRNCNQSHGTESFVTDINQLIVKTRTQTPDTGVSKHDLNSECVSDSTSIDSKDNNKNKYETKSHLLPNCNETGNCRIKPSQKFAKDNYRLSHNCDGTQLSLRRNGCKNNETNEPMYTIEQRKHSKVLCKRETYEDLYEGKVLSASFIRTKLHATVDGPIASQSGASHMSLKSEILTVDAHVRQTSEHKDLAETKHSEESSYKQDEQVTHSELTAGNETSGIDKSEMLTQNQGAPGECINMSEYTDRELSTRLQRTQSTLTDTARLKSIRKLLRLPSDSEDNEYNHKSDNGECFCVLNMFKRIIEEVLH